MAGKRQARNESRKLLDDLFTNDEEKHSVAANTVLATAEVSEALVRNGVDPNELRDALFDVLSDLAEPYAKLSELIEDWLDDGDENPNRLFNLHDYNTLMREGILRDGADNG